MNGTPKLNGRRALLAEDDELLALALAECLRDLGIEVVIAENGEVAVARALEAPRPYDWVLLDVHMPVMDGFAAARRLRADPRGAGLCILAATGNADAATRAECLAAGMDDVLVKPVDPEALPAVLAGWLQRKPPPAAAGAADTPTSPAISSAAPADDLGKLAELGRGDPARARKFAAQFAAAIDSGLAAIDAALAAGNAAEIAAQAHRLKSSARWVGALALGDTLEALETAAKAGAADMLPAASAACRAASADFLPRLNAYLDQLA